MENRIESDFAWPWSKKGRDQVDHNCEDRLHKAKNAAAVKKLLFEIKDHDVFDDKGDAPLHSYVKRTDKEKFNCLMTFLIHSKCDVDLANREGQTALHLACEANDIESAKALIAFDAKINSVDTHRRRTALDIVVDLHYDSELEILLIFLGALTIEDMNGRENGGREDGGREDGGREDGGSRNDDSRDFDKSWVLLEKEPSTRRVVPDSKLRALRSPVSPVSPMSHSGELASLPEEEEVSKPLSTATKLYPTPDASVEMGLTQVAAMVAKDDFEDSTPSVTPSASLKTTFLNNSSPQSVTADHTPADHTPGEEKNASDKGREKAAAVVSLEETDVGHLEVQGQSLLRPRSLTSPSQFRRSRRLHSPHDAGDPLSTKRRKFAAFDRQVSRKSLSEYNPNMAVISSIMGVSVMPLEAERKGGQNVLCLDGGGIKGLIQIEMLKTIEQMTGKSITDMFDWIVGTSIGAILALGVIYGKLPLSHLRRLYFCMKDTVFKRQSKILNHICDTEAMEKLLKTIFGTEMRMSEEKKPNILITAVNKKTTKLPLVFFNNCLDNEYSNELVWKVARYTSAAPVFFAECDNYVDGGVKANNPTTFGLAEIQDFLSKKYGRGSPEARISCVVSLGCGVYPPEPLGNTDIGEALKITKLHQIPQRLKELLTLLTTALTSSEENSRLCRIICEQQGISYFRFSPEIGEDVGTTEKDNHKLCEIIIRAKQIFKENEVQVEEMIQQLGCKIIEDYPCHI